jgi:hypothetical protein
VGVTWYTRLEQGQDITVSLQVLESLARVLNLNTAERQHLFVLAREQIPADPCPLTLTISPHLQTLLDSISHPAYVINPRWDIVGWNQAMSRSIPHPNGHALHVPNVLRALFLNSWLRPMLNDWEEEAQKVLALFRASSERYVGETWFQALVVELEQSSPEFRQWWSQHDIQATCSGPKEFNHPLVGRLALQPGTFQVADAPDLQMVIFTAAEAETAQKLIRLTKTAELQLASGI